MGLNLAFYQILEGPKDRTIVDLWDDPFGRLPLLLALLLLVAMILRACGFARGSAYWWIVGAMICWTLLLGVFAFDLEDYMPLHVALMLLIALTLRECGSARGSAYWWLVGVMICWALLVLVLG